MLSRRIAVIALAILGLASWPAAGQAQQQPLCIDCNPPYRVIVTPDGTSTPSRPAYTDGYTAAFTVYNSGTQSDTYDLSCTHSTNVGCYVKVSSLSLASGGQQNVTVYYDVYGAGTGSVGLLASGEAADSGYYVVPITGTPAPPTVAVIAGDNAAVASPATGDTGTFRVTANYSGTHTMSATCAGVASCVSAVPSSANISVGNYQDVVVTYNVSGSPGAAGTVTLTATNVTSGQASLTVHVLPRTVVAREQCVTVAVGPDAAYNCGDLRVVHPLPATRTMNRMRAPTLIYNSQHARPRPIADTIVTLTGTGADSVRATLTVAGLAAQSRTWPGSQFPVNQPRRVGVVVDAMSLGTGLYSYTLQISRYNSGAPTVIATRSDSLPIINRSGSRFGAGWWLAGLEQLVFLPGAQGGGIMWVGGDGSVRRYLSLGNNAYVAAAVDRADTLVYVPSASEYVRVLPEGDSVVFDAAGQHKRTVNRQGHRTRFTWASDTLKQITLPVPDTMAVSARTYSFTYGSTAQRLSQVTAPPLGATARVTTIGTSGTRITSIRNPGDSVVQFGYDTGADSTRMSSRTDRRLNATFYWYNSAGRLKQTSAAAALAWWFTPAETRGIATEDPVALVPDSVFTRTDGGRTDVNDWTTYWHGPFGSVSQVRDALGYVTTVSRADARWPALPTRVQSPNGRVVSATYDGRGNLASTTDSSVNIGGSYATTRYEWHNLTSVITKVVPPEGDSVVISYDAPGRNRLWQQDASGSTSRVNYGYNTKNQVVTIQSPGGGNPDSLLYDSLGNVARTRSPLGFNTTYTGDQLGRVTRVRMPTDSAQTQFRDEYSYYSLRDQDTLVETRSSTDTLRVKKWFDPEGNVDSLRRWTAPDAALIGTITTRWLYDGVGRVIRETAPDLAYDTHVYTATGQDTLTLTRRGHSIRMQYDALGRLTQRIVPAVMYDSIALGIGNDTLPHIGGNPHVSYPWFPTDTLTRQLLIAGDTATFTYDVMGNLRSARNGASRISRGYFPDGAIKADTMVLLPYAGQDSTLHKYIISYDYDLDRRLRVIRHPAQLAPTGAEGRDTVRYVYSNRGLLNYVYDLQGNQFELQYDGRGRRTAIVFATAGITQSIGYDFDDRFLSEAVTNSRYDTIPAANRHHFKDYQLRQRTFRYGEPGRVWIASNSVYWLDADTSTYTGLGQLARHIFRIPGVVSDEQFTQDGLGNVTQTVTTSTAYGRNWWQQSSSPRYARFYAGTGRQRATEQNPGNNRLDSLIYDAAGNLTVSYTSGYSPSTTREDRVSYYGADGLVRVAESRSQVGTQTEANWQVTFEEYRYDALGRRVMVRTQRLCGDAPELYAGCDISTMRRTVWDGSQVLWEMQAPGAWFECCWEQDTARINYNWSQVEWTANPIVDRNKQYGRIGYTHATGIDMPLSATRLAYTDYGWDRAQSAYTKIQWAPFTLVPMWNWRGHREITAFADTGSNNDGNWRYCTTLAATRCLPMRFQAVSAAQASMPADALPWYVFAFYGSLLDQQADGTGTFFRRNRYLDPQTGRFTQEDPIGLAGGLNLYGFAAGDPVNLSDPFGTCPWVPAVCLELIDMAVTAATPLVVTIAATQLGRILNQAFASAHGPTPVAPEQPERSIDNPGSLTGATPEEVERAVPEGWVKEPSASGGGTRWLNPERRGEAVRIQPGNVNDENPVKRGPYVRVSKGGQRSDPIPLHGNPTLTQP